MIKCDKGKTVFTGDPVGLFTEATLILKGLIQLYKNSDENNPKLRAAHNHLIKGIAYMYSKEAYDAGYDIEFTDSELESFERLYKEAYKDD